MGVGDAINGTIPHADLVLKKKQSLKTCPRGNSCIMVKYEKRKAYVKHIILRKTY